MLRMTSFILLLISLTSCGRSPSKTKELVHPEPVLQSDDGTYRVVLIPLNPQIQRRDTEGTLEMRVAGDEVKMRVSVVDTSPRAQLLELIVEGANCPNERADHNQDGLIDGPEALEAGESYQIPLSTQSNHSGAYEYEEELSSKQILREFTDAESLHLEEKHFLVLGLPENVPLPESVAGIGEYSAQSSFPISCGKVIKVSDQ